MNEYKPEGSLISTKKNYEYTSSLEGLDKALKKGMILEAPVLLCDHNLNLHVELPRGLIGIIPRDEVQYSYDGKEIKDIAILTRVGKVVCFKVSGFKSGNNGESIPILSRKAAQRECDEYFIRNLVPGDIIPSKVTHIESFGAFVDIGCGIISLLSIDCISVSRIDHPRERFSVGDFIYTVVKGVDERARIFVTMRELLGSWEENASDYCEGQTIRGIVRSVESYGIFVEITPNLAGLAEYREGVRTNSTAAVYIKSIIPEKMKVKLVIIDAYDFPPNLKHPAYFINTEKIKHIDYWKYSPEGCKKLVETVFS